jgi:multiple sugar transport system substrate-binding protein
VKWLWVDQEDDQVDFSNSYGTHIPAKPALAPKATKLAEGAGAEAAKFVTDFGHAPSLLWTPALTQAYTAALSNIVRKNADPQREIAAVASKAQSELKRVNG